MSRLDVLVMRLCDSMEPDNARALVDEVFRELSEDGIAPSPYGLPIMSLRDYFAGQAMALYGLTESEATDAVVADRCYERADAMLVARAKRQEAK